MILMFAVTMTSSLLGVGLLVVMIVSALATARALVVWSIMIMVGVFFGRGSSIIITITIRRTVCRCFGVMLVVTSCWIAAARFHGEIEIHNINTHTRWFAINKALVP